MRRTWFGSRARGCASTLALLLWLMPSASLAAEDLTAQLARTLALGIETSASAEAVATLGPAVVPALITLFGDASQPRHVRLRALSLLSDLDDARATAHLEALLRPAARKAPKDTLAGTGLVLRRALEGLARRPRTSLAARELAPLLAHEDEGVRHAAVGLLARSSEDGARQLMTARMGVESSRRVRKALESALTGRSVARPGLRLVRPGSATRPR